MRMAGTISPDGKRVAAADPNGKIAIYSVDGGEPAAVAGTTAGDRVVQWMPDGKSLLVAAVDAPNSVYEVEVSTGKRKLFRTIAVPDGARAADLGFPIFSKDFKSYVYAFGKIESDLYVVEGLK